MKVGLLTWAFNTNYGGSLQGLALLRYLQKAGVDVELINYLPRQSDVRMWQDFDLTDRGWARSVAKILLTPFFKGYNIYTILRVVNVKRFWHRFLKPCFSFRNGEDFRAQNRYSAIVVGSDQVWNPEWLDKVFLLDGMVNPIRRIAYASSVAAPTLRGHEEPYRKALPAFEAISVREKQTLREIAELSGKRVNWVVDPTLLLSDSEWLNILDIKKPDSGDYDVLYWLGDVEEIVDDLLSYVERTKRTVYLFVDIKSFPLPGYLPKYLLRHYARVVKLMLHPKIRFVKHASARTFVQKISGAQHVITNSFHGVMFSAIFKRNFLLILDSGRRSMHSRMTDFMERTKILTPVCRDFHELLGITDFKTSYNADASDELGAWIGESKDWLNAAIDNFLR